MQLKGTAHFWKNTVEAQFSGHRFGDRPRLKGNFLGDQTYQVFKLELESMYITWPTIRIDGFCQL